MIKIGDKVKFLNDVGGGIVKGFINKNTVSVENQDGFEIPYPVLQLVNVSEMERDDKKEISAKAAEAKKEIVKEQSETEKQVGKIIPGKDSPDFYFCFVPENSSSPLAGETELYLVNDSNFTVLYQYSHYRNEKFRTVKYGRLRPNTKAVLETIDQNSLNDLPDFGFQLLFFGEEEKEFNPPVSKVFKVNPVKLYKEKSFQPNLLFAKNAMVLQITQNIMQTELNKLTEEDLKQVIKAKEKETEASEEPKKKPAEIVEIDLHINELIENTAGLNNAEILEIQLEKVESEMKSAIQSRAKRIVFIHGVGQGVLKQEVAKLLKSKFSKYYFQDASFREYGYGATMVILRKG